MAQATLEDPLNGEFTPSVAFILGRNGDPLTLALRSGGELDHDDLLQLHEASSSTSTSLGSSPTTVFSSREPSIVTKPTSYGTDYPTHNYNGKGKAQVEYASSLSATYGSDSETEAEHDNTQRTALFGAGAWSSGQDSQDRCLRRAENSKIRLSKELPKRRKKIPVVIHQAAVCEAPRRLDSEVQTGPAIEPTKAGVCPRNRIALQHHILFGLTVLVLLAAFSAGTLVGRGRSCS
ncbi:hypothetical protein E8E11_005424 [Didymella keratinophila]|nr:hypothetical protein E8E11_005424 [Didymella keratinophila]